MLADTLTAAGHALLDSLPPDPVMAAVAEISAGLIARLRALGHVVTPLLHGGDGRYEARLLVDPVLIDGIYPLHAEVFGDRLQLRVIADADSSGRLARLRVSYEARSGMRVRWGGSDTVGTFADLGQLAKQISEEVRSCR